MVKIKLFFFLKRCQPIQQMLSYLSYSLPGMIKCLFKAKTNIDILGHLAVQFLLDLTLM